MAAATRCMAMSTATTTTMRTRIAMADAPVARLLAWLSPAFPSGGFSHSHGLEWVVEAGEVLDGPTLAAWLGDLVRWGALRNDAILLAEAQRLGASGDRDALLALVELAAALASSRERQVETLSQGRAFAVAAPAAWDLPLLGWLADAVGPRRIAYPVAVGVAAGESGLEPRATLAAFLHSSVSTLVSAAVRLVPLGQTAGLRALATLEPALEALAREALTLGPKDLGGAAFRSDLAAMLHETQTTRLFRT